MMQIQVSQLLAQSQMLGVGLLTTLPILVFLCRQRGVDVWRTGALFGGLLAVAAIGGRLWAVVFSDATLFGLSGFGSMGAIGASGAIGAILWAHPVWRPIVSVLITPCLVLIGFLRIGCVFQGCDRGYVSDWGLVYFPETISHVPFPAFDAANSLFAAALSVIHPLLGVGTYLAVRFTLEFLRDPLSTEYMLGLSRPQWGLLLAMGVLGMLWRQK